MSGGFILSWLILFAGLPEVLAQERQDDLYPMRISAGWEYRWGDSPVDSNDVPEWTYGVWATSGWQRTERTSSPEGEAQDFLWLRIRLPESLPDRPIVVIPQIVLHFDAYIDSTLIYQFGDKQPHPGIKYASSIPHTITIPVDAGGSMLSFRIFSEYHTTIGIPQRYIYLLPESGLIRLATGGNMLEFLIGIVFFFVGLLLLLLLVKERERSNVLSILFFSEFLLSISLLYLASNFLTRVIFPWPVVWYYLTMAFLFFPVGLLGFFEQVIGTGHKSIVRWLWITHLAFGIVVLLLDVINAVPVYELIYFFFGLLAVTLIIMVFTIIPEVRQGSYEARIFGIGSLVMILLGLHDTLALGLQLKPDQPGLSPWGFIFFVLILGYLLEYRFNKNVHQLRVYSKDLEQRTNELKRANEQLEAYSTGLEDKVNARTIELRERNLELRDKNETLAETLHQLQETQQQLVVRQKMASLGQLTAGIAHEMKNPLNFVNNFAELSIELSEELEDELVSKKERLGKQTMDEIGGLLGDLKETTRKISQHGRRADGIVKSMLLHAREKPGNLASTDVNALLEEYLNLAYHGMRAQQSGFNVTLHRSYDEAVGEPELIPQDIARVFLNLLNNAFQSVFEKSETSDETYMPEVSVYTRVSDHHLEIGIRDNGTGIPAGVQDNIFEPFFTTKPAGSGTGLGLSISYDIVTQGHGGTLTVQSEPGQDALFVIKLPIRESADERQSE